MAAKRMMSLRLPGPLIERIDRLAAVEGVSRTEWCSQAIARQALTSSGAAVVDGMGRRTMVGSARAQGGDEPGDDAG